MATPQPGVFDEGHDHHYFLEFALPDPLDAGALRASVRELAARASHSDDPDVVLAYGGRALATLAPDAVPEELHDFRTIDGVEGLRAPATQRDLFVWIHGTRRDLCFERALEAGRALAPLAAPSLDLPGFTYRDSRDLIGFIDGSANPKGDKAVAAAVVPSGPAAGGSFVFSQQWVHDLAKWDSVPQAVQEKIIGRTKAESIELEGDDMPPDSHVSRTDVKIDGEAMKIWRRSKPYGTVREHGLYFLAFALHPRRFQVQLDRMFGVAGDGLHDRLAEYSKPVTGSYWFAPSVEGLAAMATKMASVISDPIPLDFSWPAPDPFLFCVHHVDGYPHGNDELGPAAPLTGRQLGQDFAGIDGWRMYHGRVVPGFPQHPHRGFETITIAREGFIDHSDSLGATGRFGAGDVQWMTAGAGIVHSEMFPLLERDAANPLELFQIWLNLPSGSKLVDPYFTMLWRDSIRQYVAESPGGKTAVTVIAGRLEDVDAPAPPPSSQASQPDAAVAVWTIAMQPGASWNLPAVAKGTNRMLYFFRGRSIHVDSRPLTRGVAVEVQSDGAVALSNGPEASEMLLLQGRPIGEPVVQHGPFVMNSRQEILQAIEDYQRTGFGGWPWPSDDPVHKRDAGRFAVHANGRTERPD